jgi:Lhr-like helicase
LGDNAVLRHQSNLSRQQRLKAESRLKRGEVHALIATASLELGIDIGIVNLVCQIDAPRCARRGRLYLSNRAFLNDVNALALPALKVLD